MSLPFFSFVDNPESCQLLSSIFLLKMAEFQFDKLMDLFLLILSILDIHTKHHTYFDNPNILVVMDLLELKKTQINVHILAMNCVYGTRINFPGNEDTQLMQKNLPT